MAQFLFTMPMAKGSMIDWHFNAWAKYDNWHKDDAVPGSINQILGLPAQPPGGQTRGPGGGQHRRQRRGPAADHRRMPAQPDAGTQSRPEPGRPRTGVRGLLGISKVLWLGNGIVGDDTHGHIDDLARFVGTEHRGHGDRDECRRRQYEPLAGESAVVLRAMTGSRRPAAGDRRVADARSVLFDGQRLPASYANFYIANEKVLVPTFNDAKDRVALGILADLFPTRQVVGIHAVDLVWGLGTLHCMTQQQPASLRSTNFPPRTF